MADVNKELDTGTFPELWKSLTPAEQTELRFQLMRVIFCTRQSINNWANGKTPIYRSTRIDIAKTISKTLGLRVSHTLLFPNR